MLKGNKLKLNIMKKLFLLLSLCVLSLSCEVDNLDSIDETASEETAFQRLSGPGKINYLEVDLPPEEGGGPSNPCAGNYYNVVGSCTDGGFNGSGFFKGLCIQANVSGTYANGTITNLTFTLAGTNTPVITHRSISYAQNKFRIFFAFTWTELTMNYQACPPYLYTVTHYGTHTMIIDPCLKTIGF
jgi:hypothetical protein